MTIAQRRTSIPLQAIYAIMLATLLYTAYVLSIMLVADGLSAITGDNGIISRIWLETNVYLMTYSSQTKNLYENYNDVETYMLSLGAARSTIKAMPYALASGFSMVIFAGLVNASYFQVWVGYSFILLGIIGLSFL